jgi:thymidylate synthase
MQIITARSPAGAWYKGTKHLLSHGIWINDILEILNVCVSVDVSKQTVEEYHRQHDIFDPYFRQVFGDERIDYAASVTFIYPPRGGLLNKPEYTFLNNRWKDSYWGRMIAYHNEVNQIEHAIHLLKQGKNIKRCQIMVYDPLSDMKNMYKQPCLLGIDFKPRKKQLHTTAFFRSQRVSKSGYADYTALCNLAHYVATESGLEMGPLETIACSFHLTKSGKEMKKSLELIKLLDDELWQP